MYSLNTVRNALVMGEKVDSINIASRGSKDIYLNSLTKKYTSKPILAGPIEATAMGNIKIRIGFATILYEAKY